MNVCVLIRGKKCERKHRERERSRKRKEEREELLARAVTDDGSDRICVNLKQLAPIILTRGVALR